MLAAMASENSASTSRTAPFRALRLRNYRLYWISGLGMTASQNVQRLALAWLILDLTGSLGQLGLMILMMGLPMAFVSLWGGVLADRYDRKKILLLTQAFTASNLLLLAILIEADLIATWQIYLSSAGLGAAQALTMPARTAMVRSLVGPEDMKNAVALNAVQMQSAQVIWPSVAGGIIGLAGVSATLATSSGLSFVGIAFLSLVHSAPLESRGVAKSPLRELAEGLRYSFSASQVSTLMGMAMIVGFFGLPFMSMAPGFAREVLNFNAGSTGLFLMASGLGSIAGSIFVLIVPVRDNLRLYFLGSGLMGLSVALVGITPWAYVTFLPAALFGFCLSLMIVGGQTLLQTVVPQNILGRTTSVWSLVAAIGFVASFPIGLAGEAFGLRTALTACGLILILGVLVNGTVRTGVLRGRSAEPAEALLTR